MFKKLAMAVGVICLMGMLTACGRTSEQKVTEIRVAFNQNENHPQYRAMKAFGEKFEKETNGRYHVTIYPNGVLGEQGAMAAPKAAAGTAGTVAAKAGAEVQHGRASL